MSKSWCPRCYASRLATLRMTVAPVNRPSQMYKSWLSEERALVRDCQPSESSTHESFRRGIFFTKNGQYLGLAFAGLPPEVRLRCFRMRKHSGNVFAFFQHRNRLDRLREGSAALVAQEFAKPDTVQCKGMGNVSCATFLLALTMMAIAMFFGDESQVDYSL